MEEENKKLSLWQNFLTSDIPIGSNELVLRKVGLINGFSLVGIIIFLIFGIENMSVGSYLNGYIELSFSLIAVVNLVHLRLRKQVETAESIALFALLVMLVYLLFFGGIGGNTGILWMYSFPVVALFLKGKKSGIAWVSLFLCACSIITIGHVVGIFILPYSLLLLRQMLISLLVFTVLIYLYADLNEHVDLQLQNETQKMLHAYTQLQQEVTQRIKTESDLADIIYRLGVKNKELEDAKKAMINILEDLETEKGKLEEAKAKDEAILTSIGEGLVVTNKERYVILANTAAEEILGCGPGELLSTQWPDLYPWVDEQGVPIQLEENAVYIALTQGKRIFDNKHYCMRKDGSRFPAAVTASPIKLGEEVNGAIVVFRDISQEKEVDKAKTEFVSLASHQLRTPLSTISWYTESILAGDVGKISGELKDYLDQIYTSNRRMVDLVNALLDVSRLELGTFMIEPEPINIIEIVKPVVAEILPLAKERDITLQESYAKDIPIILLDTKLTNIIFQNLLSNAVKYTPEHGKVTLEVKVDDNHQALIIKVQDTGYGIPRRQQGKIFSKLFRADNVRVLDTTGTGLGLYIVKSIIENIGGEVWFESEEGKGTSFYVMIPLEGMKKKEGTKALG